MGGRVEYGLTPDTFAAMRLGVFGLNSGSTFRPADTIATARLAEQLGYDSVWAGEHVVVPSPARRPVAGLVG